MLVPMPLAMPIPMPLAMPTSMSAHACAHGYACAHMHKHTHDVHIVWSSLMWACPTECVLESVCKGQSKELHLHALYSWYVFVYTYMSMSVITAIFSVLCASIQSSFVWHHCLRHASYWSTRGAAHVCVHDDQEGVMPCHW